QQQINKCAYDKYISLQDVLIFGQSYVIEDYNNHYQIGEYYIKHTNASNKKKVIKDFLIKLANAYIPKRVEQIAGNLSLNYNSIQIISARKSWGSCNNLKQLKFNFRLTMIPKELIDYVICHELCHIKELNHSKRFWELLANLGYKKTAVKQAFKDYSFVLQLF
ncbi:MAG: YgjP-like metallopeptidase domain-containing protein, partial [Eubacteriales bacterium]|nr:YgjP-like metallopeptidase domain-containing protein [Eubacteriales bacterium]